MEILKYKDYQSLFVKTEDLLSKSSEKDLGTKKTRSSQSIKDFSQLSLFDVLTLQLLLKHNKPVIRHAHFTKK